MPASTSKIVSLVVASAVLAVLVPASKAEAQAVGYQYYALTPCRLVDTREAPGSVNNMGQVGTTGPIVNRTNTLFTAKGNCGIPASGVYAISANVTAVMPTADGHFRFFPADAAAVGLFSTINFVANESAVANGAIMVTQPTGVTTAPAGPGGAVGGVAGSGDFGIFLGGGAGTTAGTSTSHVVIDITGYFAP